MAVERREQGLEVAARAAPHHLRDQRPPPAPLGLGERLSGQAREGERRHPREGLGKARREALGGEAQAVAGGDLRVGLADRTGRHDQRAGGIEGHRAQRAAHRPLPQSASRSPEARTTRALTAARTTASLPHSSRRRRARVAAV